MSSIPLQPRFCNQSRPTLLTAAPGAFPDDLGEIAAEHGIDLTDPFTGDPLVYRLDDTGAVVYSVGENEIDDGGKTRPVDPTSRERTARWDLPWCVDR